MALKEIRRSAVVGAGAVGAAVASMIHDTDPSLVTVVADAERAARYSREGFLINGKRYHLSVKRPQDVATPPDLLIIATKSYDLEAALELCRPLVGDATIIVSLLNGITSEQIIGSRFGHHRVLPAMIVGIDSVRVNGRIDYANRGRIHFGPNPAALEAGAGDQEEAVEAVRSFFERCAIPCTVADNIERTLWWKFMINVGINQPSAILRATYGVFQKNEHARALMFSAMQEVVELSERAGIGLSERDLEDWQKTLGSLHPDGKTSMLQDVEAGRRTEVDLFAGAMISMGEQYGVPVPVNTALYRMLKTIESLEKGA